jgi:hypothetical protein
MAGIALQPLLRVHRSVEGYGTLAASLPVEDDTLGHSLGRRGKQGSGNNQDQDNHDESNHELPPVISVRIVKLLFLNPPIAFAFQSFPNNKLASPLKISYK